MDTQQAAASEQLLPQGRYSMLDLLGEGGMGSVWRAEERDDQADRVRRLVAIKLIRAGLETREVLLRFEAEWEALSRLDHDGIARILGNGRTTNDRPYVVMEFVPGRPITEYADAARLDLRHRLALFEQVCSAIAHAHGRGVLHRDLKPGNVLAHAHDDGHVATVIDFGLARAMGEDRLVDQTLVTWVDRLLGTPAYMPPEQASGFAVPDVRGDVWGLGTILYELLCGQPPRTLPKGEDDRSTEAIRQLLTEAEVVSPDVRLRTLPEDEQTRLAALRATTADGLARGLAGELTWICDKALRHDPRERYATAEALAADVRAWLDGRAVEAAPPGRAYRLRKFARRNRGLVIGVSAATVTLLIGLAATSWQAVRATRAERVAAVEAERATASANEATINLTRAEAVVDILTSSLRNVQPEFGPDRPVTLLDWVEQVSSDIGKLDPTGPPEQAVERQLSAVVGLVLARLTEYERAEQYLRPAFKALEAAGETDDPILPRLARALAATAYNLDRPEDSLDWQDQALSLYRDQGFGETSDEVLETSIETLRLSPRGVDVEAYEAEYLRLAPLVADGSTRIQRSFAGNFGRFLVLAANRPEEAEPHLRHALSLLPAEGEAADRDTTLDRLRILNDLATTLGQLGKREDALVMHREIVDTFEQTAGPDYMQTWVVKRNLARALEELRRDDEALPIYAGIYPKFLERFGSTHMYSQRIAFNYAVCIINAFKDGHDVAGHLAAVPDPWAVVTAVNEARGLPPPTSRPAEDPRRGRAATTRPVS
jgi:tetratricopeptide (TPR) repeat protein